MFNFRALFFLTGFSVSLAYHSSQDETNRFDIQNALTNSCDLDINFESCLMKTFIPLYSGQIGQVELDWESCTPPNLLESDLVSVFEQSRTICLETGTDIEADIIESHISSLMLAFSSEGCLVQACKDSKEMLSMDPTTSELVSDVKTILFDTIGTCSGIQIDPETCLADFAINQILSGEMSGSEGLLARRILSKSVRDPSLPHDESFLCRAPMIDEDIINDIIEVGNSICGYSNEDADTLAQALNTMFSAEGCFMDLCRSIESEANQIISLLFESVGQCSGVMFDPNSCIVSTSLEMLLFGPEGGGEGEHARRLLEHHFDFKTLVHGVLEDAKSICYPPDINMELVSQIVEGASTICSANGEDTENDDIQNVILTIESLFSEQSCWTSLCTDVIGDAQTALDKIIDVPELAVEQILSCTNVEINFDSCIEREMYDELVHGRTSRHLQVNQPISGLRRKRGNYFNNFDHGDGRRTEELEHQNCIIPRPEPFEKDKYFAPLIETCSPTEADIDLAWSKLQTISLANGCWDSICGEAASTFLLFQSVEKCLNFAVPIIGELSVNPSLLCMLDFAMQSTSIFEPSSNSDYCPNIIAPAAIEHCMDVFIDDDWNWNESMSFSYEYKNEFYSMSYNYEHHSYFYSHGNENFAYYNMYPEKKDEYYSYNYGTDVDDQQYFIMYDDKSEDGTHDDKSEDGMHDDAFMKEMNEFMNYINYEESLSYSYGYGPKNNSTSDIMSEKLCMLLDQLRSGHGQECLKSLTNAFEGFISTSDKGTEPSAVPSMEPSVVSSRRPSAVPSLTSSKVPSLSPSNVQSPSPTRVMQIENESTDDDDDDASTASMKSNTFAILVLSLGLYFMNF